MFYKKQGMPEIGEVLICTVKRVLPDSVFVELDEYGKEAMIHISEVAPGRIRNIRDYVKENKKVVCKVLNINKIKGHVDLSLRRVNQAQKIQKNNQYKQEQKAEKILKELSVKLKTDLSTIYNKIGNKIIENYGSLTSCFNDIINEKTDLKELKVDNELCKNLINIVKEKIKPLEVKIIATLKFETDAGNGIEIIKKALDLDNNNVNLTYVSAPNYRLDVTSSDYKKAEGIIKNLQDKINDFAKKNKAKFELIR